MKCFTLRPSKDVILEPNFAHPLTYAGPELYPSAQVGIRINRAQCAIEIGPGIKASLCPELLSLCKPDACDKSKVIIERASLDRQIDGTLALVPEKTEERESALVLLDLGRGAYNSVRYELGMNVVLRARRVCEQACSSEELALVQLPIGRPLAAYRCRRGWQNLGSEIVGEQLLVRFDGQQLKCEVAK